MIGRQDWDLSSDWPRVVTDRCWRPSLVWSSAGDGPAQVSVHNSLQPYWYSAQWYWQTLCYSQISTHYYRHYWTRTRSEWSVISGYSPVELIDPGDLQSQDKPRQQLPPVIRRQPGKQTILYPGSLLSSVPSVRVSLCLFLPWSVVINKRKLRESSCCSLDWLWSCYHCWADLCCGHHSTPAHDHGLVSDSITAEPVQHSSAISGSSAQQSAVLFISLIIFKTKWP